MNIAIVGGSSASVASSVLKSIENLVSVEFKSTVAFMNETSCKTMPFERILVMQDVLISLDDSALDVFTTYINKAYSETRTICITSNADLSKRLANYFASGNQLVINPAKMTNTYLMNIATLSLDQLHKQYGDDIVAMETTIIQHIIETPKVSGDTPKPRRGLFGFGRKKYAPTVDSSAEASLTPTDTPVTGFEPSDFDSAFDADFDTPTQTPLEGQNISEEMNSTGFTDFNNSQEPIGFTEQSGFDIAVEEQLGTSEDDIPVDFNDFGFDTAPANEKEGLAESVSVSIENEPEIDTFEQNEVVSNVPTFDDFLQEDAVSAEVATDEAVADEGVADEFVAEEPKVINKAFGSFDIEDAPTVEKDIMDLPFESSFEADTVTDPINTSEISTEMKRVTSSVDINDFDFRGQVGKAMGTVMEQDTSSLVEAGTAIDTDLMLDALETDAYQEQFKPKPQVVEKTKIVEKVVEKQVFVEAGANAPLSRLMDMGKQATVVVTGDRRSGVTLTAMNIATLYAKRTNVLYVDFDIEHFGAQLYLGIENLVEDGDNIQNGLCRARTAQMLQTVSHQTEDGYHYLYTLIGAGTQATDEDIVRVSDIIAEQQLFNLVVIDCPFDKLHLLDEVLLSAKVLFCVDSSITGCVNSIDLLDSLGINNKSNRKFRTVLSNNMGYIAKAGGRAQDISANLSWVHSCFNNEGAQIDWTKIKVVGEATTPSSIIDAMKKF